MFSVSENDRTNVTDSETVNENSASRNLRGNAHLSAVCFDNIAYFTNDDIFLRNTHLESKSCVLFKVLVLAMHGNEEFRLGEREHKFKFLLTSMTRNVDLVHSFVYYFCARFHEFVHNTGNVFFVAGNRGSRDYDEVHRRYVDLFVVVHSHSCES